MIPSNPYDAKGLLISCIEDDDPVLFLEPKRIYNGPFDGHHETPVSPWAGHPMAEVPAEHYTVPLGKAATLREGADAHRAGYGAMVHVALAAAQDSGIDAEVIDLRTLVPVDIEAIERLGEEDRPLRHRARGHAHVRFRRGAVGPGAGGAASTTSRRRSSG